MRETSFFPVAYVRARRKRRHVINKFPIFRREPGKNKFESRIHIEHVLVFFPWVSSASIYHAQPIDCVSWLVNASYKRADFYSVETARWHFGNKFVQRSTSCPEISEIRSFFRAVVRSSTNVRALAWKLCKDGPSGIVWSNEEDREKVFVWLLPSHRSFFSFRRDHNFKRSR